MIAQVVRLAVELHELVAKCEQFEARTVVRLECHEGDPRAQLVICCEDRLFGHLECDLTAALEMLATAHERYRGHNGLRVEIVARKPWVACMETPRKKSGRAISLEPSE